MKCYRGHTSTGVEASEATGELFKMESMVNAVLLDELVCVGDGRGGCIGELLRLFQLKA